MEYLSSEVENNALDKVVNIHGTFACDLHPPEEGTDSTRLLFVCHAENMQRRHLHLTSNETGLSAKGWEQTTALAQWLHAYEEIDTLFADSRLSSRLTAQRIGQQLGLLPQAIPDFPQDAELSWATQPPVSTPDFSNANSSAQDSSADSPDGAHRSQTLMRYTAYAEKLVISLSRLLTGRWGQTILLVADSVATATFLRSFAAGTGLGITISYTSLSEVVYQNGRWSLAYANRIEHMARQAPSRRIVPDEDTASNSPDLDLNAESEKLAHFYNQVALSLDHKNREEQESEQIANVGLSSDMSADQIRSFAELEDDSRLLLVGAGTGQRALSLSQVGISEVVGIDVSPLMLERAEFLRLNARDERLRRVNFRLASAHDLPFTDARFDVALCIQLFHHWANPVPALLELQRTLTPNGKLVLIDIDGSSDAVRRATQNAIESKRNPTHTTIRTKAQIASMLNESGFQVIKEQSWRLERSANAWLDEVAVNEGTRLAVLEMLEASIETNAAGLHVRRQDGDLRFDAPIVAFVARQAS